MSFESTPIKGGTFLPQNRVPGVSNNDPMTRRCYDPAVLFLRRSAAAAVALALLVPTPALARRGRRPSLHDRVVALEKDVELVWQGLSRMADDFLPKAEDSDRTLWYVARGEMAFFAKKPLLAAVYLFKAIRQPGFHDHAAYPEALYFLSEALFKLNMHAMARRLLEQALTRGQNNRYFKSMLALYLEVSWQKEDERIDGWVGTYRSRWMNRPEPEHDDMRLRYQLGKVFIRREQADVARALFEGIPEDSPLYGRARYLVAVTLIMDEAFDEAALGFEDVALAARKAERKAWLDRVKPARTLRGGKKIKPKTFKTVRGTNPLNPVERVMFTVEDPGFKRAKKADEMEEINRDLAMEAALSRARMAMLAEDPGTAARWYRWIPNGAPKYREVLEESIWCQLARKRYSDATALTDELINLDGGNGSALVLRAHLVAESGEFRQAEELFVEAMAHLEAAALQVLAAGEGLVVGEDGTIQFDPRIAAWTDPDELSRASTHVALLNERLQEVSATQGLLATLTEIGRDPTLIPSVKEAHARGTAFRRQIEELRLTAAKMRQKASGGAGDVSGRSTAGAGGDAASPPGALIRRLESVEAWILSLDQHLTFYLAAIDSDGHRQAEMINRVVDEEGRRLGSIKAEVGALRSEAVATAKRLAAGALERVKDLYMKAELGLTEVSYKRKDWVSRQITEIYAEKKEWESQMIETRLQADSAEVKNSREVAYPPGLGGSPRYGHAADSDDDDEEDK